MSTTNKTTPSFFIEFHGMTLLVVQNGGIKYIEAKPLTELLGMDWHSARRTILSGDNEILYGTKRLMSAQFNVLGGNSTPKDEVTPLSNEENETKTTPLSGVLHIRFERAQMFLSRVNTSQMRNKGNELAANYLLALQIEWAQVLNKYDMDNTTIKKGNREDRSDLLGLIKARNTTTHPAERAVLTSMIADACAALGYPLPADPQLSLQGV